MAAGVVLPQVKSPVAGSLVGSQSYPTCGDAYYRPDFVTGER